MFENLSGQKLSQGWQGPLQTVVEEAIEIQMSSQFCGREHGENVLYTRSLICLFKLSY